MAAAKKIVFITADDWEGLYIDGTLVAEGHNIPRHELMRALGFEDYKSLSADYEWLSERGTLPKKLSEVKLEK